MSREQPGSGLHSAGDGTHSLLTGFSVVLVVEGDVVLVDVVDDDHCVYFSQQ